MLSRAWDDRVLGLSAEAAFWQLLSLPPLFLALLGSLGYLSGLVGAATVNEIEQQLLEAFARAFTPSVVDEVIAPTVGEVLREGRAEVISVGFVIALWAGSSATSTFVNTVTIAYGMRDLRGAVHSRLLALFLYLLTVVIGIVLLPVMVLGPGRLVRLFPESVRGDVGTVVTAAYWPTVGVLLLLGLVTFYHLAPPRRLPWWRGFPGAVLAGFVFLGGSLALRFYIGFVVSQGFTYGALAAPIGALLFFYVLALAVLLGAELNATMEQNRSAGGQAVPTSPDGELASGTERTRHRPAPDGRGPVVDRAEQPLWGGRRPAAGSVDGTEGAGPPGPAGSV
jgi:membrane protein